MERAYRCRFSVAPQTIVMVSVLLLLIPSKWAGAWFIAAGIHELFHYVSVLFCGGRIYSIHVGMFGAQIRTDLSSTGKEILCLLAGPAGALSLLACSKRFPHLAVCALLQSVYNLLPFPELDGGQVLLRVTGLFFSTVISEGICTAVRIITQILITSACIYGSVLCKLGILPMLIAGILLLRHANIKIPCKQRHHKVQ